MQSSLLLTLDDHKIWREKNSRWESFKVFAEFGGQNREEIQPQKNKNEENRQYLHPLLLLSDKHI